MKKAVIIGAGSIGALKNNKFDSRYTENILTIAHAFYTNEGIDLIGIVDKDTKKAKKAANKWDTSFFEDYQSITINVDIVAVCVDTESHLEVIHKIILSDNIPKVILLEKPAGVNLTETREIQRLCSSKGIVVVVDYIRRFTEEFQTLAKVFNNRKLGRIHCCTLAYTRGLRREASHAIDLFNWWFGKFLHGSITDTLYHSTLLDYGKDDPSYGARLVYDKCPHVYLCPVDGRHYAVYDIHIYTELGRVSITEHGRYMEIVERLPEPVYGSYNFLPRKSNNIIKTGLTTALSNVADNCVDIVNKTAKPICSIEDAIKIQGILTRLKI